MDENVIDEEKLSEEHPDEEMPKIEVPEDEPIGLETDLESQQPDHKAGKPNQKGGGKWVWLGILVFVIFIAAGIFLVTEMVFNGD